jgi:anti-sigma factor RsiW
MAKTQPLDEDDREDLVAYLDGEADKKTARSVEAKLAVNADARQEAEALKRAWDLLDYLPRPEPSPNFTHRTIERLSGQVASGNGWRWRPWLLGAGWAASILIAALVGFGGASLFMHRQQAALDDQLVRDLHPAGNVHALEHVDDIDFLHKLANPNDPDFFSDDSGLGS